MPSANQWEPERAVMTWAWKAEWWKYSMSSSHCYHLSPWINSQKSCQSFSNFLLKVTHLKKKWTHLENGDDWKTLTAVGHTIVVGCFRVPIPPSPLLWALCSTLTPCWRHESLWSCLYMSSRFPTTDWTRDWHLSQWMPICWLACNQAHFLSHRVYNQMGVGPMN